MEIGLVAGWMTESPVGFGAVGLLDDGGQAENGVVRCENAFASNDDAKLKEVIDITRSILETSIDEMWNAYVGVPPPLTIALKLIGSPGGKRGEIVLNVPVSTRVSGEKFEAGGLPELVEASSRMIGQFDGVGVINLEPHPDMLVTDMNSNRDRLNASRRHRRMRDKLKRFQIPNPHATRRAR